MSVIRGYLDLFRRSPALARLATLSGVITVRLHGNEDEEFLRPREGLERDPPPGVVSRVHGLELEPRDQLPEAWDLELEVASDWPPLSLPSGDWGPRGTCPTCHSEEVTHIVIGMPDFDLMQLAPSWVEFAGCVVESPADRRCESCGRTWSAQDET